MTPGSVRDRMLVGANPRPRHPSDRTLAVPPLSQVVVHNEELPTLVDLEGLVPGYLEVGRRRDLAESERLPDRKITRHRMAGRVRRERASNRLSVSIQDLEHAPAELHARPRTVILQGSLPHDDATDTSRPDHVIGRIEDPGSEIPTIEGRHEVEAAALDGDVPTPEQIVLAGPLGREVRVNHPRGEDRVELLERRLEAYEVKARIDRSIGRQAQIGNAAPEDLHLVVARAAPPRRADVRS
jgi:hypothetical protein